MKYFYQGPGASPYFRYRVKVTSITEEMFQWCQSYPRDGAFERWHVEWHATRKDRNYDVVQFESEKAAYMFTIAFSEHIIHE